MPCIRNSLYPWRTWFAGYGKPDFNVNRTQIRSNVWTKLAKALNIFQKKPYIEPDKCIRCGICVNSCPVPGKAVDFRKGKENAAGI